jgi:halorhodopsin
MPGVSALNGIAVPLQQTQADAATEIASNTLLASSLWVNVALAGLSALLFVYMGRSITNGRVKAIWGATLMIPLVSISSYLGLLSGLTVGFIQMPAGHALAGEVILSQWGRYLTWALSTPMILLALGLLADVDIGSIFTVIAADIGMCITGLAAALITSSYGLRWAFYFVSCAFFLAVLYALVAQWPDAAADAGTSEIFSTLRALTIVLWLGYPIIWAIAPEGLALIPVGISSWGYSALDIFAKYIFAFLLIRWVTNNESSIRDFAITGSGGHAAPADD